MNILNYKESPNNDGTKHITFNTKIYDGDNEVDCEMDIPRGILVETNEGIVINPLGSKVEVS